MTKTLHAVLLACALALTGCVGLDMGSDPGGSNEEPGRLSNEQKWHLRSAATAGEHELSATAARLAWEDPDDRRAIVEFAAQLRPEAEASVAAAVYGRPHRVD